MSTTKSPEPSDPNTAPTSAELLEQLAMLTGHVIAEAGRYWRGPPGKAQDPEQVVNDRARAIGTITRALRRVAAMEAGLRRDAAAARVAAGHAETVDFLRTRRLLNAVLDRFSFSRSSTDLEAGSISARLSRIGQSPPGATALDSAGAPGHRASSASPSSGAASRDEAIR